MTTTSEPDADDTEVDDDSRERPRRRGTVALTLVVLFLLASGAFAWLQIYQLGDQAANVPEDARQAAILLAEDLATYDYRDLGGNFVSSPPSRPQFAGQLRELTDELGPELQQTRAVASRHRPAAAVLSSEREPERWSRCSSTRPSPTRTPVSRGSSAAGWSSRAPVG